MADLVEGSLSDAERAWARKAISRKRLFLSLSKVSVAAALLLAVVYVWERARDPSFAIAPRAVIVLLILLNGRQNLRQYKYAALLEKLVDGAAPRTAP